MGPLPVDAVLPQIVEVLRRHTRLVLRAEAGAGKTTRVPPALLDAGVTQGKAVVVLEPRRIAARAAAEFVARQRQQPVGQEVGYRVRLEQRGGPATKLWYATEGVVGRQLGRDPFLEEVGVVVLDEFHERHVQGDVLLGVVRELQDTLRPDLRLVVMSATLETEQLAAFLGGCPVVTVAGRAHPVTIGYRDASEAEPVPRRVAGAVRALLDDPDAPGDILVFLPGAADIRQTAALVERTAEERATDVCVLHGDLPLEAQRHAIEAGPRRRIVLSTNVAETALTIEGVTTVIDSGLAREGRFDARHGINVLRTVRISQAAAEQRAGRAGRTGPGRCIRLWGRLLHAHRRPRETPEILRLDLTDTVLQVRAWGLRDPTTFAWLEAPPAAALARAEQLLAALGAIDAAGRVTDIGRAMLRLPVAPRLARIMIEAQRQGVGGAATLLVALAAERDILLERRALGAAGAAPWPAGPSDLLLRMQLFREAERRGFDAGACRAVALDRASVRAVERTRRHLARLFPAAEDARAADDDLLLRCLLAGFPDRVVRRRSPGSDRGIMVGGVGVALDPGSVVREAELFLAIDVQGSGGRGRAEPCVRIASAVQGEWLAAVTPQNLQEHSDVRFDAVQERVIACRQLRYVDLVLQEVVDTNVEPGQAAKILAVAARADPERAADVTEAVLNYLARVAFLAVVRPDLGLPSEGTRFLADTVSALCVGRRSFAELRRADVLGALRGQLTWEQREAVNREAPDTVLLPSGRAARIEYRADRLPRVRARIQELFGLRETPRVAGGRVGLLFELLAPSHRPVQITDDLGSFWRHTYPAVRKILRGRYPKHAWPEDPLQALPASRPTRPR